MYFLFSEISILVLGYRLLFVDFKYELKDGTGLMAHRYFAASTEDKLAFILANGSKDSRKTLEQYIDIIYEVTVSQLSQPSRAPAERHGQPRGASQ